MPTYDPGPFWAREEFTMPPRVVGPGHFERELEPLVNALGASDLVLGGQQTTIATNTDDGLDTTYATTIGVAAQRTSDELPGAGDLTAAALSDRGAGADRLHDASTPYLPGPDATPSVDFTDPPAPPGGGGDAVPPDGPPLQ